MMNKDKNFFDNTMNPEDDIDISQEAQELFENSTENEDDEYTKVGNEAFDESQSHYACPNCAAMEKDIDDMKLRTIAEMDNFKKRLLREKEEQSKYAAENVLQDIIPALDNLDLALQYANNEACKDILLGIQMTRKLLLDSLKNHGLEAIMQEGVPFDPEIHEAVGQEESDEIAPNHVLKLLQKGYLLKGRLLRSAKVIVAK